VAYGRYAQFPAQQVDQRVLLNKAKFYQAAAKLDAKNYVAFQGFIKLTLRDGTFADK
jgi:hypothetical protein